MKSNALVVASLAWTAGIIGCIDENRVIQKQEPSRLLSAARASRRNMPITDSQDDANRNQALTSYPLFIGGEKVQKLRTPVRRTEAPSAMVQPIEAEV